VPVATAPSSSFDEAMYATSALPPNAPQAAAPENGFSFGKLKLNKKKGTATQVVNVPGPGTLTLSGAGVKGLTEQVAGGRVKLAIVPVAKKKKQVKRNHSAKIRIGVTFTPPGGSANTQARKLTLRTKKR
jgi:hypothetical protein